MKPSFAIILDFEATCDNMGGFDPKEVIEFPSVLLSLDSMEIVDEFESFVRPHHNPRLTDFCRELTSIAQDDIEGAPHFKEVFEAHQEWLRGHGLDENNSVFVTCGDWDLGVMLPAQCRVSNDPVEYLPPVYSRWQNIKVPYCQVSGTKSRGMAGMLKFFGLPLVGTHHRGIDDCRNIAAILRALVAAGATVEPTGELELHKYPPIHLQLHRDGETMEAILETRSMKALQGLAGKLFRCRADTLRRSDGANLEGRDGLRDLRPGEKVVVG